MTRTLNRVFLAFVFGWIGSLSIALAQSHSIHQANPDFFVKRDCNSSNCHGNTVENSSLWNQSGEIWFQHDPHANAYARLLNADSKQIVHALWDHATPIPKSTRDPAYLEFLETRCAACHASELAPKSQRIQGVDCQACHGSAIHWDDSHLSSSWKALGAQRFYDPSAQGRVNTESAWEMARVCGSCHIGQIERTDQVHFTGQPSTPVGQREVSHQLMAAGHPPTYFELSNFLTRYPKHWWDSKNVAIPQAKPDEPSINPTNSSPLAAESLDTWRIGKLVNAKQRLELLKNRLGKPEWPELTEHRCTSCHHPIDTNRKTIAPAKQPFAEWDGWYLDQIELALAITQFPSPSATSARAEIAPSPFLHPSVQAWALHHGNLKQLLLNPIANHPTAQTSQIRTHLDALLKLLDPIIDGQFPIVTHDQIPTIQNAWNSKLSLSANQNHSWESAVQWKFAYQALGEALVKQAPPGPISSQPKPQDWDFPTTMWTRTQQMPYRASGCFDPEAFQKQLLDIIDSLKR